MGRHGRNGNLPTTGRRKSLKNKIKNFGTKRASKCVIPKSDDTTKASSSSVRPLDTTDNDALGNAESGPSTFVETHHVSPDVQVNSDNIPEQMGIEPPADGSGGNPFSNLSHFSDENFNFEDGKRIVDLKHFMKELLLFPHFGLFSCTGANIEVLKEVRKGFSSKLVISCNMCRAVKEIYTEKHFSEEANINYCAVAATVSIGCGYSQLNEFTSALDIPSMGKDLYIKCQNNLSNVFIETAREAIIEAGKEEKALALESGDVDEDGVPFITVVADGAYCKRSYRTNYNSSSGVACIIGEKTNKVLYVGVKNKYCCVCDIKGENSKEHVCFKNYRGPSTGMESEAIVEGFKMSMEMLGLRYKYLIADGDSSVYKKICNNRPYGNFLVEKVECKNHLLRNFCTKLKDIASKKHSSKGAIVPLDLRTLLKNNILRLRSSVVGAVAYYNKREMSELQKIELLKNDLSNSPYHVFDSHKNCATYFCKNQSSAEDSKIKRMEECGLMYDIMTHINRLKFHANSLIKNKNNNYAEHFNSIVAKFVGGKRVNFSSKGSYTLRCHAAALSYNAKGQYHHHIHKAITGKSPGGHTKNYIKKMVLQRNYSAKRRLNFKENPSAKKRKVSNNCGTDADYGPLADKDLEIPEDVLVTIKENFINDLGKDIDKIFTDTVEQRNSSKWKTERRKRITASNFGRICKLRETTDKNKIVKELMFPTFTGNKYTTYGIDNESIAASEFERVIGKKITPCGLFIHKDYPYLAATPDGLIGNDEIMEIKCPYVSKDLPPETAVRDKKIKFATIDENNIFHLKRTDRYYFQVQGQLFISNKKACYFVVWSPKGLLYEKIEIDLNFCKNKILPKLNQFYFEYYLLALLKEQLSEC